MKPYIKMSNKQVLFSLPDHIDLRGIARFPAPWHLNTATSEKARDGKASLLRSTRLLPGNATWVLQQMCCKE
jgi:hypothetical protein